jgi:hypothetical protein
MVCPGYIFGKEIRVEFNEKSVHCQT